MKKIIKIIILIVLFFVFGIASYSFIYTSLLRNLYVSLLSKEVNLPIEKWEDEGLRITSEKYLLENPTIIKTEKDYKMYFHDKENIYVATSSDGLNWQIIEKPIFTRATGPVIVDLPDGKLRLYFYPLDLGGPYKSAISEDGINFEIEEGIRFEPRKDSFASVEAIGHPEIIRVNNLYLLYFDNGANLTKLKATAVNNKCEFLYEENKEAIPEIHYAYSNDGLNWTYGGKIIKFKQVSIPDFLGGWSPGVLKVNDKYLMYFPVSRTRVITTQKGDVTNCKIEAVLDPLWLAVSTDGINFDIVKQTNIFKSDPEIVKINGKLRLYAWGRNNIYSYIKNLEE